MNSRKKIVITGASGFLGSHLVERLKEDIRYTVYALTSRPEELRQQIGGSNIRYLHKDAAFGEGAQNMLQDATVVHCAYPRNAAGKDIADGLKYIQKVFEAAAANDAAAIINISSQSVYSAQRTEAATEETPVCPETPYAIGKYAVELMLESICRDSRTAYTNARMASLIGPGFNQRIVNRLIRQALRGESIHVNQSLRTFGFLDVQDAVRALVLLILLDENHLNRVYNVGNGKGYSVERIVREIQAVFQSEQIPFPEVSYEEREETGTTSVEAGLLRKDTGFEPEVDLSASILRILRRELAQK